MTGSDTPPGPPTGSGGWGGDQQPPPSGGQQPPPGGGWGGGQQPPPGGGWGGGQQPPPGGGWGPPQPPPPGWVPQPWGAGNPWGAPQAPKPGIVPLRPLNFGEVLDGAFTTVQRYPKVMLGISTAIMGVLTLVSFGVFFVGFGDLLAASESDTAVANISDATWISFFVSTLVLALAIWVGSCVLTGMITVTVARGVLGQPADLGDVWRSSRPHIGRLVGLTFVIGAAVAAAVGVVVALVVLAFVIHPAIGVLAVVLGIALVFFLYLVVWPRTAAAPAALVLETRPVDPRLPSGDHRRIGVVAALQRSWNLVQGRTLRTFGLLFVANLIAAVVASVVQTAFTLVSVGLGAGAQEAFALATTDLPLVPIVVLGIGYVASAVLQVAFLSGVNALIYVDARMRREGLDIELAQAATTTAPAPSPWAAR
jgi:hypothetical protein